MLQGSFLRLHKHQSRRSTQKKSQEHEFKTPNSCGKLLATAFSLETYFTNIGTLHQLPLFGMLVVIARQWGSKSAESQMAGACQHSAKAGKHPVSYQCSAAPHTVHICASLFGLDQKPSMSSSSLQMLALNPLLSSVAVSCIGPAVLLCEGRCRKGDWVLSQPSSTY